MTRRHILSLGGCVSGVAHFSIGLLRGVVIGTALSKFRRAHRVHHSKLHALKPSTVVVMQTFR